MRPKGMEDLAAFSAREVRKVAAEKETRIPLQKESESQNKQQSHPTRFSKNCRK